MDTIHHPANRMGISRIFPRDFTKEPFSTFEKSDMEKLFYCILKRFKMRRFIAASCLSIFSTFAVGSTAATLEDFGHGSLNPGAGRPLVVVFINSPEAAAPQVTTSDINRVESFFFGRSDISAPAFFRASSNNRFFIRNAGTFGPYNSSTGNCRSQPGSSYGAGRAILRSQAIRSLLNDASFNAKSFDEDGDGILTERELLVHIVYSCPPNTGSRTSGEVRSVDVTANGMRFRGSVASSKPTLLAPTALHELSHLLGTIDLYTEFMQCLCRQVSLMDVSGIHVANLDGPHRFLLGWTDPVIIDIAQSETRTLPLNRDVILHDASARSREFFYIEHRQKSGTDSMLPNEGVAIWRVKLTKDKTLHRIQLIPRNTVGFMQTRRHRLNGILFDETHPVFSPLWFDRTRAAVTLKITREEDGSPFQLSVAGRDAIGAAVSLPDRSRSYFLYREMYKRFNHESGRRDRVRHLGFGGHSWSEEFQFADAALNRNDRQIYFFRDGDYWRYDTLKGHVDHRTVMANVWSGVPNSPDAAVMHPTNGKAYFFKDANYFRYDFGLKRVDKVGRTGVDGWWGVPANLDAALLHKNGKAYFFRGDEYFRFDFASGDVDKVGTIGQDGWIGLDTWN